MTTAKMQCQACKYGKKVDKSALGQPGYQCKRFPPQLVSAPTQAGLIIQSIYPPVDAEDHCGEFAIPPISRFS